MLPRANVSAIPGPIIPVPTTVAVVNLVFGIAVILTACAGHVAFEAVTQ
jgi:hypothetical protein